ncbi:hypothetical protein ANCDUO_23480 [Ancylostoma duodenale]|uniref:RING-type domain-containing protein n=1 Tax=Ancylostoma duodenale TaxID=51022 RepID=A0A0C2BRM9_9BILA|nr:hypothetical protein ANCDUO_23480 [Ancylostoma duodenale]
MQTAPAQLKLRAQKLSWYGHVMRRPSMHPTRQAMEMNIPVAINVPVRCDGPCGGLTDVDYVQFGLCEHIICRKCYETVKGADHDGLHGCCNAECLELARNERHRRRRAARKEDRGRAKRVRSDVTFRMEYDNKDFEHLVEDLRKAQKSPTQSARTDSCMTSFTEPAFPQS